VSRLRLGVVLPVPEPVASAVDGLRRAFSDPALDQVAPHVTLAPPVNVKVADVAAGLAVLRDAAAATPPVDLVLGPVTAFPGDEGVAYLALRGADETMAALHRLQSLVFRAPFEREVDHDFVPHVTVTQGVDPARLEAVLAAASGWDGVPVRIDALHLLEERHLPEGRRWTPIADIPLRPRAIVGRGGLEIELTAGLLLDPEAASALPEDAFADGPDDLAASPDGLMMVARLEGEVVGVARGRRGHLQHVWVDDANDDYVRPHLVEAWFGEAERRANAE
jgi:2'-5' RNA ligase